MQVNTLKIVIIDKVYVASLFIILEKKIKKTNIYFFVKKLTN